MMRGKKIRVAGELLGIRTDRERGSKEEIVRVLREQRPRGPAENALIRVRIDTSGSRGAHYISWINYGDLDEASAAEPGAWELVEPAAPYSQEVIWTPFITAARP